MIGFIDFYSMSIAIFNIYFYSYSVFSVMEVFALQVVSILSVEYGICVPVDV